MPPALKPLVTQVHLKLAKPRLRLIKAGAAVAPGVTTTVFAHNALAAFASHRPVCTMKCRLYSAHYSR